MYSIDQDNTPGGGDRDTKNTRTAQVCLDIFDTTDLIVYDILFTLGYLTEARVTLIIALLYILADTNCLNNRLIWSLTTAPPGGDNIWRAALLCLAGWE